MENPLAHNFPGGDIVCELHGAGDPGRIRPQTVPRLDRVDTRTSLGTAKGAWGTTQGDGDRAGPNGKFDQTSETQ